MRNSKLFALVGMAVLGVAIVGALYSQTSNAQTNGPKPLIVADIDSVNGMQTSSPLANYPAGNPAYPGQEIQYDNEGISIFIVNPSHDVPILTGGADFSATGYAVECGHLGIQGWQGGNYAYKLTDGNTWQKRRTPCSGVVVIGSSGQIRAQTLTIKGTSIEGKPFTLQVNVPDPSLWDDEVGGGSRRLYVDDTGATYGCYSRGYTGRTWDRGCQYSPAQALALSAVGPSPAGGAVNGNGLCQAGETPSSAPNDCPETYDFTLSKVASVGEVQLATGTSTASLKFSLQNKGNVSTDFPVYCDAGMGSFMGNMYYTDGAKAGQKFVNPGAYEGATSLPSANIRLDAGATQNFDFKFDIPQSGSAGTWTAKCHTYPRNNQTLNSLTEKKQEITDTYTVKAGACTKLGVAIPKTTYTKDETVSYTISCASSSSSPVANATVQVVKPDGTATTYVTVSNASALTHSFGFATSNLSTGTYTLRACMDSSCSSASMGSVNFTVSNSASAQTCSDSDGGMNYSLKGVGTGTYAGAASGYIKIYGQDPDPTYPKSTSESFSTYYDHCATATQLNEAFCDSGTGKLSAMGYQCPNGCSAGVCIPAGGGAGGDLIGHWKFDGSGANEVVGSPAAVAVGNASFKSDGGKLGGYAYIPGSSDKVKIPYSSRFDLPNEFSVSFWFRQRTNQPFNQELVYKGSGTNNYNFKIFRYLWNQYNNGAVIAGHTAANTGFWTQASNNNEPSHNVWHHVVYTKSASSQAYYIDGQLINSKDFTQYTEYGGPAKTPATDIIIADTAVDTDIDDLKIYGRPLRADEVAATPGLPQPVAPTPGAGAPEPPNNEPGAWAQVEISTGQIVNIAVCTRSVCGINGEYHGYVPPPSWPSGSVWWPTTKRYIWQMPGQAGYRDGSFNFSSYVFTVTGGTIYNGVFTPSTPVVGTSSGSGTPWIGTTTPGTTTWPIGTSTSPTPVPPPTPWIGTGTPGMEDHAGCDMTMYYIREGRYVDERGAVGPATETLTNTGKYYKWSTDHYHLCGTGTVGTTTPPNCLQVMTRAVSAINGECREFSNSCLPSDWIPKQCEIKDRPSPPEPRECAPGEMPGGMVYGASTGTTAYPMQSCMMPSYRWNLKDGKWEKCDAKRPTRSVNFYDANERKNAQFTSCQPFDFELDADWRAERFRLHDPRIEGNEWYEPPWDATAESFRYNQKTDAFEKCGREPTATMMMPYPNEYVAPCSPVPEKDKSWMLLRARSNYKQHLKWQNQKPNYPVPEIPFPPDRPSPEQPQPPLPLPQIPEIPAKQCKQYMNGIRNGLNGDKQFWKDVKNQLKNAPKEYADRAQVEALLAQSKTLILDIEGLTKKSKCASEILSEIQQKQQQLHGEIFSELSTYLPQMNDYAELSQCMAGLSERAEELRKFMTTAFFEPGADRPIREMIDRINAKLKELKENRDDFEYDAVFECREFRQEVDPALINYRLSSDTELNRIVDEVVEKKFEPIIAKLTEQLEQSGKRIDELIFKVAEVHKAIESVSQSASQISEKIAVSYAQLSRFGDEYEKERREIQSSKDRLIPLVEMALQVVKEKSCVPAGERESLVQEFGAVASVNWLSEKADELEKRLNFFITSCRSRDIAVSDLAAFHNTVSDAEEENLRISYEQKLTPFNDVPTHEWYYGGMVTAAREGYLTQGRPGETVLRQDALLMVLRAAGVKDDELKGECEVPANVRDVSPYARCAVKAGQVRKLAMEGPMSIPISREEVAGWIVALNLVPEVSESRAREIAGGYDDLRGIRRALQMSVTPLIEAKVMVGVITDTSKKWQPREPLTRAALAVVLEQLLKAQQTPITNP